MNNDFNFYVPLDNHDIIKAAKKTGEDRYKNMLLSGVASDNSEDLSGEILEPTGYITDVFLKSGNVNYEHLAKKSPKFIIGKPISAKVSGNDFLIKAKLLSKSQLARDTWDKLIELEEEGSPVRAGWSIEGKALQRDPMNPKRITKALITNVALTFNPVNQNTFADICKGIQQNDFVEQTFSELEVEEPYIFEFIMNGKKVRVNKNYDIYIVKSTIDTQKPLIPESLEKKSKNIVDINKSLSIIVKHQDLLKKTGQFEQILGKVKKNL